MKWSQPMKCRMLASMFARTFILIIALFAPSISLAQLPESLLLERVRECDLIGTDWHASNACYMRVAIEKNDSRYCDNINWSSQRVACKRRIIYSGTWSPKLIFPQLPFAFFVVSFIAYFVLKPPRFAYVKGAIIGSLVAEFALLAQSATTGVLLHLKPYAHHAKLPVQGMMVFSPQAFADLSPDTQFVAASAIFYGLVLGIVFLGDRKKLSQALFYLLAALLFTFWMHPHFDSLRSFLDIAYETLTH